MWNYLANFKAKPKKKKKKKKKEKIHSEKISYISINGTF